MERQASDIILEGFSKLVHYQGNVDLLKNRTVALLCSIQCPGEIILKIFDWMHEVRDREFCVLSGFQSPMEQECLRILLKGTAPVILCPARSLKKMRVPVTYRKLIQDGRMLLISPFEDSINRKTQQTAALRNRFIADISDWIFIPHASPDGKIESLCTDLLQSGKPLYTFNSHYNQNIISHGAKDVTDIIPL